MENSILPENPVAATGYRENEEVGAGFGEEEEDVKSEEDDRYLIGHRWPRQETLALLRIRSDMDAAFRDSSPKGKASLWEEVSRKLSKLGYNRSTKKCKEKFENVYKYHRRTKGGRSCKPNSKYYRFLEQLEALDNNHVLGSLESADKVQVSMDATPASPINIIPNVIPMSFQSPSVNFVDTTSTSTASIYSEESDGTRKKKRKLMDFFERLMKQLIEKQEKLQKKFLQTIEKCEQNRIAREEAWKKQELDMIKRERELLAQERSIAAAKDTAVLLFLQRFSQQDDSVQMSNNLINMMQLAENQNYPAEKLAKTQENGSMDNFVHVSSSRWPKEEIEALIRLRSNLDMQYQENGPKGSLWEGVSAGMKKLGYNRSAKRCKEKWENMNKYFKRVKDKKRRRAEDSKTCPYFQQLDALYKDKIGKVHNSVNSCYELKSEELKAHMMGEQERMESATTEDGESENVDQNQDDSGEKGDEDGYRIVANNPSSVVIME
uniref:Uncharacterized protein MANES_12G150200 n=1 Tax=Rhizophora mucronata TaxID=61149 RepID=A0A2P2K3X6_RHIMU